MTEEINKAWNWKGIQATEVIQINDFGNIIFKTTEGEYWRICPEELSCVRIAINKTEVNNLLADSDFKEYWDMTNLVEVAKAELGQLEKGQKYCLKIPAVIGGAYERSNLGKINLAERISFSGNAGFQIKDLADGQAINLKIK